MKNVFYKNRIRLMALKLRLLYIGSKITMPFRLTKKLIDRFLLLNKIEKESEDGWERHVKLKEVENQDEFELARTQFSILKTHTYGAIFKTCFSAGVYTMSESISKENLEHLPEEFKSAKQEFLKLIADFNEYAIYGIQFDSALLEQIKTWEIDDLKDQQEFFDWQEKLYSYIENLKLEKA